MTTLNPDDAATAELKQVRVNRAAGFREHMQRITAPAQDCEPPRGGQAYPMLQEEPEHCAETLFSVLESLWKLRARNWRG